VLIKPVDMAQGLVAGLGGARTEALMAAPIVEPDGACVAVVLAGAADYGQTDLDRLWAAASEAAPGFAVAQAYERWAAPARTAR
jgi:hypothetical protein